MNLTDLLIIYLACGAPFGVYYLLQNRTKFVSGTLWLNTFYTFAFWVPMAFKLLRENKFLTRSVSHTFDAEAIQEKKLDLIQKRLEKILQGSGLKISIFELREMIDRYVGLTYAKQNKMEKPSLAKKELFSISKNNNLELAAICLDRRNRTRLSFHQKEARQDFLDFVEQLSETSADSKTIGYLAVEFVEVLNDFEAKAALEKMFISDSQTDKYFDVQQMDKAIWNTELHKPLPVKQISTRL